MPRLSSTSLFHFTTAEGLIGILENNFYARYSQEQIPFAEKEEWMPTAMVCFCDIPLSHILEHSKRYGSYGIGMRKEWAERKQLNPVLYLKDSSELSRGITQVARNIPMPASSSASPEVRIFYEGLQMSYLHFLAHFKIFEGSMNRGGKTYENVKYYDEKEWRHVPNPIKDESIFFMQPDDFKNPKYLEQKHKELERYPLTFTASDIQYLIVPSENQIWPLIKDVQRIKGQRYEPDVVTLLTSRIITLEQIGNDF